MAEKMLGGSSTETRFDGRMRWGLADIAAWMVAVTIWGGLGSLLDSVLGGWLQASVVDRRSGKVVEGRGGRMVSIPSRSLAAQAP
jgi:hypothetical protein